MWAVNDVWKQAHKPDTPPLCFCLPCLRAETVKSEFVFLTHNAALVAMFALLNGSNVEPAPFALFHLQNDFSPSHEDEACMYTVKHKAKKHSALDSGIMLTVVLSLQSLNPEWFHFGVKTRVERNLITALPGDTGLISGDENHSELFLNAVLVKNRYSTDYVQVQILNFQLVSCLFGCLLCTNILDGFFFFANY